MLSVMLPGIDVGDVRPCGTDQAHQAPMLSSLFSLVCLQREMSEKDNNTVCSSYRYGHKYFKTLQLDN